MLAYLIGQLTKRRAQLQGLELIDEQIRLLVNEINAFYREQGLTGQLAPESKQLRDTRARITSEFQTLLDAEDYWATEEGVRQGTLLLSLLVAYGVAGAIAENIAKETPGVILLWQTQLDPQVCGECLDLEGVEFDPAGELPDMPLHMGCWCFWRIVFD